MERKAISVVVEKHSGIVHNLLGIRESILEKSPMYVMNVRKALETAQISLDISELTLGKDLSDAKKVGKHLS